MDKSDVILGYQAKEVYVRPVWSRLALVGFVLAFLAPLLGACFILFMLLFVGMTDRSGPHARPLTSGQEAGMACFEVGILASILVALVVNIVSMVRIMRADGRLKGLWISIGGVGITLMLCALYALSVLG